MRRVSGRDGLLRGDPPYRWWQWLLVGSAWSAVMFLIFGVITGFRAVLADAIIWTIAGASWAIVRRQLIIRRERRAGRLPSPKQ